MSLWWYLPNHLYDFGIFLVWAYAMNGLDNPFGCWGDMLNFVRFAI